MENIGETLKKLRKDRKLTQGELAKLINVERSTLANWERGAKQPSLNILVQYARLFGVSLDELAGLGCPPKVQVKIIYDHMLSDPLVNLLAERTNIPARVLAAFIAAMREITT
jgi:transcriptional regulator with XRE-family HTH domain